MNKTIASLLALTVAAGTSGALTMPTAFAGTAAAQTSKIVVNGQTLATPPRLVHNGTTYMPIWYVQQVLNKVLNLTTATDVWDGSLSTPTWNLTIPNANSNIIYSNSGSTEIEINGSVVEYAPRLVETPSGAQQSTTYMPIWYIQQLLNRVLNLNNGTDVWNGGLTTPTWTITTQATGNTESQTAMAAAMWNVFDATTFDVHTHATMQQSGVTPTTAPVTAGQVATWLNDWMTQSKGYALNVTYAFHGQIYGNAGQWIPWSLKYETSTDPYTWASENDLFDGVNVAGSNSVITTSEVSTLMANLKWMLNGYKKVGNVYHLHAPVNGDFVEYADVVDGVGIPVATYEKALAEDAYYADRITATVTNGTLNLTLPNVANTPMQLNWNVVARGFQTYGTNFNSYGGVTLHVKLGSSVPIVSIAIQSNAANLTQYLFGLKDNNGVITWNPVDEMNS
ncbi:hypothetical protein [Alicyclobacillus sp. ALC3]|uniref:hypothetical protein n=1 Tax=Alicyclobacillus sp. ALC3 TaxID=2796143 RepID=UPI002379992D|nr:hypothetical protein [Alicyclobacillus sp. ALC3]WDL99803.1 hypothetical protein JC200_23825 [Alicyclobacillus sp. ALC3]